MTATVGFAPATTPGLVTGGSTTASEEGAPEGLFAALLAMLTPGMSTDVTIDTPDGVTSTDFASFIEALKTAATSPADEPGAKGPAEPLEAAPVGAIERLTKSSEGKPLLKDLGDALIALNEALEAGQPVDPALKKKLGETLDVIAVLLGIVTPPSSAVDPGITALASGDGVLPIEPTTAPPTAAPAQPDAEIAPASPTSPAAERALTEIPAADVTPAKSEPTTLEEAREALRQLGLEIGKLVDKLTEQDPELANKLAALADKLQSVPATGSAATASPLDKPAISEIERIVAALSEPKPKAAAGAPQPFTAPALELPEAVAPAKPTAKAEPAAPVEPAPTQTLEASTPEANIAKPAIATRVAADAKPDERAAKPAEAAPSPAPAPATDPTSATAPAQQPAAAPSARTIHAAYQAPVQQVNLPQVAFEVVRQFDAGNTRFQIRLDPPELGRIDVKLDVDKSGTVNARMTVERPETLDLMQRDQRALQQALQQAGLDTSKTSLEFSLRQNPFAQQDGMGDDRGGQPAFAGGGNLSGSDEAKAELATTTYRGTASAGGVNLFV